MGVDVSSMTYVGVYADDAEAYLVKKGILQDGDLDDKYDGDFEYAMQEVSCPLQVQAVSYYSAQGYYVGFETHPFSYKDFDGLIAKFKEITGDDAEVESFEQWH
jgi:hypothetical protein